jgi:hypothetical protein
MTTSYIPATLRQWNALDAELRNSRTLSTFKYRMKSLSKPNPLTKAYNFCRDPSSKYLTQLRLGLSKLRAHLFTYNIIPEPSCPFCHYTKETTAHFLLECPAFAAQREVLFHDLRDLLPPTITANKSKCISVLLFGLSTVSLNSNKQILSIVHNYISSTQRFLQ